MRIMKIFICEGTNHLLPEPSTLYYSTSSREVSYPLNIIVGTPLTHRPLEPSNPHLRLLQTPVLTVHCRLIAVFHKLRASLEHLLKMLIRTKVLLCNLYPLFQSLW